MDNLLEKGFKFEHYFFTDKLIKVSEALGGGQPTGWCPFVETYAKGQIYLSLWLRVTSSHFESNDLFAIVEPRVFRVLHPKGASSLTRFPFLSIYDVPISEQNGGEDGGTVFVTIPKSMEEIERMQIWVIPSVVRLIRLETFNNIQNIVREKTKAFSAFSESFRTLSNRESDVRQFSVGDAENFTNLPNDIIGDRAEVVNTIPCNNTQSQGDFLSFKKSDPMEVMDSITIFLGHHFIWYTVMESLNLSIEVIKVQLCSFESQPILFKVGIQNDETSETKDSKGSRDTYTIIFSNIVAYF